MKIISFDSQIPLIYISSGHFIATEPWTHMKRIIESYELIIGIKGTLYIQQEAEKFAVNPGEILLLSPGRCHEGYRQVVDYNGVSFYWLHFQYGGKENPLVLANTEWEAATLDNIYLPDFLKFEHSARITILFKQLLDISHSHYYSKRISDYLLTTLLFEISQQTVNELVRTNQPDQSMDFSKVLEWIKINMNRKISLEDVAEAFNFNKRYFSRLFKKRTGVTVNQYIMTLKLDHAKNLFLQSEMSIKEIAYAIGFTDEKYFMKLFKKHEQLTPTEFRRAYEQTYMNNK